MTRVALDTMPACDDPATAQGATPATEETRLIDAARTDPGAFARLYRRHFRAVAGYLYRRFGDEHLAEDLAAETFIAAWKALPRYRHTGVPFRSWLLRIATNQARAAARSDRPRRAAERSAGAPERLDDVSDDTGELVHAAMRAITPEHQDVIALVHFESMTVAQAAAVLSVREGTVKSRLSRARTALRVELERLGAAP